MIIHPIPSSLNAKTLGVWGEKFVGEWLQTQGWKILHSRWRCRWGELDVIAYQGEILGFVEVKTRYRENWDEGGLLAVDSRKQAKLLKAAQCFLEQFPEFAEFACRFDVALVRCQRQVKQVVSTGENGESNSPYSVQLSEYQLTLVDYISSAFTAD